MDVMESLEIWWKLNTPLVVSSLIPSKARGGRDRWGHAWAGSHLPARGERIRHPGPGDGAARAHLTYFMDLSKTL